MASVDASLWWPSARSLTNLAGHSRSRRSGVARNRPRLSSAGSKGASPRYARSNALFGSLPDQSVLGGALGDGVRRHKACHFCPSRHAKRLTLWPLWLEESLLVLGVPHRQVVLTIPKRLRASCRHLGSGARACDASLLNGLTAGDSD
jgi:hypothetical protein